MKPTFSIVLALAILGTSAYGVYVFNREMQIKGQLSQLLTSTLQEKEKLQSTIEELQQAVREKETQLEALRDVQAIKMALGDAQLRIDTMNREFERISRDRAAVQQENVSLSARLQNLTKEYMKNMDELKKAQDEVGRASRLNSPDRRSLDELKRRVDEKSAEAAGQKAEMERLRSQGQELAATNKALESKVRALEAQRQGALTDVERVSADIAAAQPSIRQLNATIAGLSDDLKQRDKRIAFLQEQLEQQSLQPQADPRQSAQAKKALDELQSANRELKSQVSRLTDELSSERARAGSRADSSAQEQLGRLSQIMIRKEVEIDTLRKEAVEAKQQLLSLQTKAATLESTANAQRINQQRLAELEGQRLSLQTQLDSVKDELQKKNQLLDSVQKSVEYLSQQVAQKDEERSRLQTKIAALESTYKGDLEKERAQSGEINAMYASLKSQVSQFSDAIRMKESEIESKRREADGLRSEVVDLRGRFDQLQSELEQSRDRQRTMMEDLAAAVRLNALLQDRLKGAIFTDEERRSLNPADKRKADELRRKIEVILEPEKN